MDLSSLRDTEIAPVGHPLHFYHAEFKRWRQAVRDGEPGWRPGEVPMVEVWRAWRSNAARWLSIPWHRGRRSLCVGCTIPWHGGLCRLPSHPQPNDFPLTSDPDASVHALVPHGLGLLFKRQGARGPVKSDIEEEPDDWHPFAAATGWTLKRIHRHPPSFFPMCYGSSRRPQPQIPAKFRARSSQHASAIRRYVSHGSSRRGPRQPHTPKI